MDLSTSREEIARVARQANRIWMSQAGRNPSDAEEGFLEGKRFLIHDRNPHRIHRFSTHSIRKQKS